MNQNYDFLIVGGSAAGTTASETIRNLKPEASIAIVTDENHTQYSRVLLPHYVRGKVERDQVFLKKDEWYAEHKIELIKGRKVKSLELSSKSVFLETGEQIVFGKLLIAIGGYVIPLNAPGIEDANICYMRTLEDCDRIIAEAKKAKSAVIIGGGFIGLEFCSGFRKRGVEDVTVLVKEPYFWSGKLDEESAGAIADVLVKNGVKIVTNVEVNSFDGNNVIAKNGNQFSADVVGVGIGIRSDLTWLDGSGVKIDKAIVTNEFLETSIPDVYAAGDCAQFHDVIFERQHMIGNWSNATSQGSAVGKTMAGQSTVFETASSYSITFFEPPRGGSCTFIGVTDDEYADSVIKRGNREGGKVTRIFVKKLGDVTRIVGATVINNPMDVAPLTVTVKGKKDISAHLDSLGKAEFDLKTLIA